MLIPWLFYPTLLLHPLFGLMQAVFIDYKVVAFGFVNYSMLAVNDISLADTFHGLHELTAVLLILIFLFHVVEKSRKFFIDDSSSMKTEP